MDSHSGEVFEISGMSAECASGEKFFNQSMDASEGFCEGFVADFFAIDANALVDCFEMGRGVQSRSKAGVAKDGFEECGSGAFAVGAGDVSAGVSTVGAAEALGENGDIFEVELRGGSLRPRGQFAPQRKQVADRGLVIHLSSRANRGSWR